MSTKPLILILDFGSQYTQLIARRVREQKVYSEIHPFNLPLDRVRAMQPAGIILSGGPSSVYDQGAPRISPEIFALGACCIMFGILAWHGARMAWDDFRYEVTSPALGLPQWFYSVWLPVLSLLIVLRLLLLICARLRIVSVRPHPAPPPSRGRE